MIKLVTISQERKFLKQIAEIKKDTCLNLDVIKSKWYETDLAYYQVTLDFLKKCQESCQDNSCDAEDVQVPLLLSQTESAVAFLMQVFFAKKNMFEVIGEPEIQEDLDALEKELFKQQQDFKWLANFIPAFRDVVKYNTCFMYASYKSTPLSVSFSQLLQKKGVSFQYLNPYHMYWDTTVRQENLAQEGLFISYKEYLSHSHLKKLILDLGQSVPTRNRKKDFISQEYRILSPAVNYSFHSLLERTRSETDWEAHFADLPTSFLQNETRECHEIERIAVRLPDKYEVHYFIILDSFHILYHEILPYATLPFLSGVGITDAHSNHTKSIVSSVIPYQHLASKLIKAKLEAARRAINDRGIFNPRYIATEHINQKNSSAKIPIRPNKQAEPSAVQSAYREIPYRDTMGQTYLQDAQLFLETFPELSTGISRFRQGPRKGNRSATEFNFLSEAADGRLKLVALMIESTFMSPCKELLKTLVISHRPAQSRINYNKLIQQGFQFNLADGLTYLGILEDAQFLQNFTTAAAQIPDLQPVVSGAYKYLLSVNTSYNIKDFIQNENTARSTDSSGETNSSGSSEVYERGKT